jgi:hypothetical protein
LSSKIRKNTLGLFRNSLLAPQVSTSAKQIVGLNTFSGTPETNDFRVYLRGGCGVVTDRSISFQTTCDGQQTGLRPPEDSLSYRKTRQTGQTGSYDNLLYLIEYGVAAGHCRHTFYFLTKFKKTPVHPVRSVFLDTKAGRNPVPLRSNELTKKGKIP